MTTHAVPVMTANDRLKQRFDSMLAVSLVLAAALHVLLFEFFPEMRAVNWANPADQIVEVLRIDEFKLPEAPEMAPRPAKPVMATDVSIDQTLPTIGFDEYVELPPPPAISTRRWSGFRMS